MSSAAATTVKKSEPYRPPVKAAAAAASSTGPTASSTTTSAAAPDTAPAQTAAHSTVATAADAKRFSAVKPVKVFSVAQLWAFRDDNLDALDNFNFESKLKGKLDSPASAGGPTPSTSASSTFPDVLVVSSTGFKRTDKSALDQNQLHLRNLQAALNRLTPDNYGSLVPPLLIPALFDDAVVGQVVARIYDKSLDEPLYASYYAQMCADLALYQNKLKEGKTFRVSLLKKAQEMFEAPYNLRADGSTEAAVAGASATDIADKTRKRKINNIRFTGQLHQKQLLADKVLALILKDLLFANRNGELDVEVAVTLLDTVGSALDATSKGSLGNVYEKLVQFQTDAAISSRVRFMVQNLLELRAKNWQRPATLTAEELIAEQKRVCGIVDEKKDPTAWWPHVQPTLTAPQRQVIQKAFDTNSAGFFADVALVDPSQTAAVNRMVAIADLCNSVCLKSDDARRAAVTELLRRHNATAASDKDATASVEKEVSHAISWIVVQSAADDVSGDCPLFYKRLAAIVVGSAASTGAAPQIAMLRDVMARAVAAVDSRRENASPTAAAVASSSSAVLDGVEEGLLAFWQAGMKHLVEVGQNLTHGAILSALSAVPRGTCWREMLSDVLSALTASGCCTVSQLSTWRENHATDVRYETILEGLNDLLAI